MKYRIIFEIVSPIGSGVAEEDWFETINNTDDPWDQYNTLKEWAESGEHLIRNVRLFEISETVKEITDVPTDK